MYKIAFKRLASGLQLAFERLAEDEASEARQAFKRIVRGVQVASLRLGKACDKLEKSVICKETNTRKKIA